MGHPDDGTAIIPNPCTLNV